MRWIWIDRFIDFQPLELATAIKSVTLAEEHLHDHWAAYPVMPFSLMIEGMAQTAGILVGQARNFQEKVILAKITNATIDELVVAGDQLKYHARIGTITESAAVTEGVVYKNDKQIGRVDLMFSHIDQNRSGRQFPQENFVFDVFTDRFAYLLAPFVGESGP